MAAFTSLALAAALGMMGGVAASKLKKPAAGPVTAPGPTSTLVAPPTTPPPPDPLAAASAATTQANVAAQRQKKRATGFNLPGQRIAMGTPLINATAPPRTLIGGGY